jgi:polyisoprenoid-binding protein YceI
MNTEQPVSSPTTPAPLWKLDPAHSSVRFSVRHLMITSVHGAFEQFSGTIRYDRAHPERAELSVSIVAASVQTREPQRDAHLRSADFFDVEQHPLITYRSTRVRRQKPGELSVEGELSLRGVTRSVTLEVTEITGEQRDLQGTRRFGASARATIRRSDFGITFNKLLEAGAVAISDEVALSFDVSLVASGAGPEA